MNAEVKSGWFVSPSHDLYSGTWFYGPYGSEEEAKKNVVKCENKFSKIMGTQCDQSYSYIEEWKYVVYEGTVCVLFPVEL